MGAAELFAKGAGDAQDYATKMSSLEVQRDQLELQQQQLAQTREHARIESTMKLMNDWEDVAKTNVKPVQKAKLEKLKLGYQQLGLQWDPVMEASVTDDAGRADFLRAMAHARDLSPDQFASVLLNARNGIDQGELYKAIQSYNQWSDEQKKIQAQGDQQRQTEAFKAGLKDPQKERENELKGNELIAKRRGEAQEIANKFNRVTQVGSTIFRLTTEKGKDGKVRQRFNDLTGAEDFQLLKAFNQYNDTAAVREGETNFVQSLQGIIDTVKTKVNNWKEGDKLSPTLRREIYNASVKLNAENERMERDMLGPVHQDVEETKTPALRVFTKRQKDLIEGKSYFSQHSEAGPETTTAAAVQLKDATPKMLSAIRVLKASGETRQSIESKLGRPISDELATKMGL
jgi:hypothetical protein